MYRQWSFPRQIETCPYHSYIQEQSKSDINNHRPISVLLGINKIFEYLISCRLQKINARDTIYYAKTSLDFVLKRTLNWQHSAY